MHIEKVEHHIITKLKYVRKLFKPESLWTSVPGQGVSCGGNLNETAWNPGSILRYDLRTNPMAVTQFPAITFTPRVCIKFLPDNVVVKKTLPTMVVYLVSQKGYTFCERFPSWKIRMVQTGLCKSHDGSMGRTVYLPIHEWRLNLWYE